MERSARYTAASASLTSSLKGRERHETEVLKAVSVIFQALQSCPSERYQLLCLQIPVHPVIIIIIIIVIFVSGSVPFQTSHLIYNF